MIMGLYCIIMQLWQLCKESENDRLRHTDMMHHFLPILSWTHKQSSLLILKVICM